MTQSENQLDNSLDIDESSTPHQMIAMLLAGALTRIDEAMQRINEKDIDAAAQLVIKTINIVEGLQENLNLDVEGEIAPTLNRLYSYISERLRLITTETPLETLEEVKALLLQVQDAWLGIEEQASSFLANTKHVEFANSAAM